MAASDGIDDDGLVWTVLATGVGLAAATLVRKGVEKGWAKRRGFVPGKDDAPSVNWSEAALFAAVSGVAVGLARMLADRGVQAAKARRA